MEASRDALEGLTEELRAKAVACRTEEELRGLLESEGVDLGDDLLEGVAGGDEDDYDYDIADGDEIEDMEAKRLPSCKRFKDRPCSWVITW